MNRLLMLLLLGALLLMVKPGFAQCPAVGADPGPTLANPSGCGMVITINPGPSLSFTTNSGWPAIDAAAFPASADDILIGVVNNSGFSIQGLVLTGLGIVTATNPNPANAFAFDLDGLCVGNYGPPNPSPAGCPFDLSGYGGPGTSLAASADPNCPAALACGTVTFVGGLANQATAYFSLEAPPTSGFVAPEPASIVLAGSGLASWLFRRRRSSARRTANTFNS